MSSADDFPPAPKSVIFDWDNTLADNWGAVSDALNTTFAAMGHEPWTVDETKARVRASLRDSFPAMFGDAWTEARKIFYDRYAAIHIRHLTTLDGAAEILHWLAGEGLYLGVVSNKSGDYLRAEAEELGWSKYFGHLVGATDAAADKPAPEPADMVLSGSGLSPGPDIWYVGDGAIDVTFAMNTRMTPVVVMGAGTEAELACHNVDQFVTQNCRITRLRCLKPLVERARHTKL
jgi:phosphoglycolate phosphatase